MQVKKKLDPSYLVHNNRVIADGGTPGNGFLSDRNVTILKRGGLWNNCVFFADGIDGKKQDYDGTVGKLYDLKNNADLTQASSALKPTIFSNGSVYFNGATTIISPSLGETNSLRTSVEKFSVGVWIKHAASSSAAEYILGRRAGSTNRNCWQIFNYHTDAPRKFSVILTAPGDTSGKLYYSTNNIYTGDWVFALFTFDGTVTVPATGKIGELKLYINAVEETVAKVIDNNTSSVVNTSEPISVGAASSSVTFLTGSIGANMVFDRVLTTEEIAYLAKNTNPNRLSSIVSPEMNTYVTAAEADLGWGNEIYQTASQIEWLKNANLWSSCIQYIDGMNHKKYNYLKNISKVYDLKGNNNMIQGTAASQPRLNCDGSILNNGASMLTTASLTSGPIREITNKMSVSVWFKVATFAANGFIIGRHNSSYAGSPWNIITTADGFYVSLSNGTVTTKAFVVSGLQTGTWYHVSFTFDGNAMDGAVNGLLSIYLNGQPYAATKSTNSNLTTLPISSTHVAIGANSQGLYFVTSGTVIANSLIFNTNLTDANILDIYNNTNPNRLSKLVSPQAKAHIERVEADGGIVLDYRGLDMFYDKINNYGLAPYCKLFAYMDGGVKNPTSYSTNLSKIYNIQGSDVNADGVQATALKQPNWNPIGMRRAMNTATVTQDGGATPAGLYFGTTIQDMFRGKSKGALLVMTKRNSTPDANARNIQNSFRTASGLITLLGSTITTSPSGSANNTSVFRRVITGTIDTAKVFTDSVDDVGIAKVVYADWGNNLASTYRNGVQNNAPAAISTSGVVSDVRCDLTVMGANYGGLASYGSTGLFTAFEGDFDITKVAQLSIDVKNYFNT